MMNVRFRTNALQRCFEDVKEGTKTWNAKLANKYIQKINLIYASDSAADLRRIPQLHFHALEGALKGKFAINLEKKRWRIILTLEDQERTAWIEEVSNHYGD
jgi:plasmid maintenance system killer protein